MVTVMKRGYIFNDSGSRIKQCWGYWRK